MAGKINSRRNLRVACGCPAKAEGPRGPVKGTCREISQGGMFFLGSQLPVGKTVEFSVDLPQVGKVQVTGEIKYHHSYASEGVGMGIRFTRISQEHLALVHRYVERKQA